MLIGRSCPLQLAFHMHVPPLQASNLWTLLCIRSAVPGQGWKLASNNIRNLLSSMHKRNGSRHRTLFITNERTPAVQVPSIIGQHMRLFFLFFRVELIMLDVGSVILFFSETWSGRQPLHEA